MSEIICICCPRGCNMDVNINKKDELIIIGNGCKRGETYAKLEYTAPVRTVTTTIRVKNGNQAVVPVKTNGEIPKKEISRCMQCIQVMEKEAPIRRGDVLLKNVADSGVDIIATKTVERRLQIIS